MLHMMRRIMQMTLIVFGEYFWPCRSPAFAAAQRNRRSNVNGGTYLCNVNVLSLLKAETTTAFHTCRRAHLNPIRISLLSNLLVNR